MSTFWHYALSVLTAIGAGIVAYATTHQGPPVTYADFWTLFVVIISSAGIGGAGKAASNAIDYSIKNNP